MYAFIFQIVCFSIRILKALSSLEYVFYVPSMPSILHRRNNIWGRYEISKLFSMQFITLFSTIPSLCFQPMVGDLNPCNRAGENLLGYCSRLFPNRDNKISWLTIWLGVLGTGVGYFVRSLAGFSTSCHKNAVLISRGSISVCSSYALLHVISLKPTVVKP
jgi:hypothetical protein